MELPIEIQKNIQDYARPMTRPTWRQGCFFAITFPFFEYLIHSTSRDYKIKRIVRNFGYMYHAFYLMDMNDYEDEEDEVIL
jgi:hypothetical protein